jgi:hypothetical protein
MPEPMKDGVALPRYGRVSILVFDTPEQRKRIGELLANAPDYCTRIAISDDAVPDEERQRALDAARIDYPRLGVTPA